MRKTIDMKYPDMRITLGFVLESLSNPLFQWQSWIERKHTIKSSLDSVVHFLFDDTELSDNPYGCIGFYLKTEKEAAAIKKLINAVSQVIEAVGKTAKDEQYITHQKWNVVLDSAHHALKAYTAAAEYQYKFDNT